MEEVRSKEVIYMGYRFRSETEAMWACYFHNLLINYEYEKETFLLPNGMKYLPDFQLGTFYASHAKTWTGKRLWAEVKGVNRSGELANKKRDIDKVESFSCIDNSGRAKNPIIILPTFPRSLFAWLDSGVTSFRHVDGDWFPCFVTKDNFFSDKITLCGADSNYFSLENERNAEYGIEAVWETKERGGFKEVKNGD